ASEALAQIIAELGARERRRTEADQLVAAARAWHRRLEDALAIAGEVTRRRRELEEAEAALLAAAGRRAVADAARDRRRAELARAEEDHRRAAQGLADIQRGIEELHRRAGTHRQAIRRMREAEAHLGVELSVGELDARLVECRAWL